MGKFTTTFSQSVSSQDKKYKRNLFQTYLTGPEWRNVEMAEEFAQFLQEGNPFYRFPFFKQIFVFWKVFFNSYQAARKHHSHFQLLFSEYMLMNLFIGVNSTVEWGVKGLASLFLWPFLPRENKTVFQQKVAETFKNYADFIHHTPFYNYSYLGKLKSLYSAFWNAPKKSFADLITLGVVTADFLVRGIISAPVGFWYNQEENKAQETTDIIVKKAVKHSRINSPTLDNEHVLQGMENVTQVGAGRKHVTQKNKGYEYYHLRVSRYEGFAKAVKALTAEGFKIQEIAGNATIQVKCTSQKEIKDSKNIKVLYRYENGVDKHRFFALDVNPKNFRGALKEMAQADAEIKLMHDF